MSKIISSRQPSCNSENQEFESQVKHLREGLNDLGYQLGELLSHPNLPNKPEVLSGLQTLIGKYENMQQRFKQTLEEMTDENPSL